jgi:hypothetical protein
VAGSQERGMTSQIPFAPLTPEALSRLTPEEREAFLLAAQFLAGDQKPPAGTIVTLVQAVQRLIGEPDPELMRQHNGATVCQAVTAERERIRHLAVRAGAVCAGDEGTRCYFADLIGPPPRDLEAVGAGPLLDPDCRDGKCGSCVGAPCEHECHRRKS